ncbi:MAG TPA: hypothetical protein PLP13_03525 [bacterium]|nr:hypothetical protein [bacterium]
MQEGFQKSPPAPLFPPPAFPLFKRGTKGDLEISPSPSFIKRGVMWGNFIKRGVEWGFVREGDLK